MVEGWREEVTKGQEGAGSFQQPVKHYVEGRRRSRLLLGEEEEKAAEVEVTEGAWDVKLPWPREKSFPKTREVSPRSKKLELPEEEEDEG